MAAPLRARRGVAPTLTRRALAADHCEWTGDYHGQRAHVAVQRAAMPRRRPRWHWLARLDRGAYGSALTRRAATVAAFAALRALRAAIDTQSTAG